MEEPLDIARKKFIEANTDQQRSRSNQKTFKTSFSLSSEDLEILEAQIDRAISLNMRSKNRTDILRMAIRALESVTDEKYTELYKKV